MVYLGDIQTDFHIFVRYCGIFGLVIYFTVFLIQKGDVMGIGVLCSVCRFIHGPFF